MKVDTHAAIKMHFVQLSVKLSNLNQPTAPAQQQCSQHTRHGSQMQGVLAGFQEQEEQGKLATVRT